MFNEIDGDIDNVAFKTFKVGLPAELGLRKSSTGKPVTSVRQLMDQIDKYRRVEEDQQQGKGKGKVIPQERKDFRSDEYSNNRPQGILRDSLDLRPFRWLTLCFENQCIKSWKRSRRSHTSNGQTKWKEFA